MTTSMTLLAAAQGIKIEGVSSRVEGDVDIQGFLGLNPNAGKGFKQIRVSFEIQGASPEDKQQLIALAKQSPIFNTLINPIDVAVDVQ